ncbi:MAG: AFG1 family ATPase [Hyphomicrobiales bacterium]|nr:AFG1 family ATPase [Hyphomicrobiales bacterium]
MFKTPQLTPSGLLAARIAGGSVKPDAAQQATAQRLDLLAKDLRAWRPGAGWLGGLIGANRVAPKGLYIHGKVGRGKTMLMDLFHEAVRFEPRRRVHFHAFMQEVHARISKAREHVDGDPIPVVAEEIARSARLLCFDELHVTDIADAMILGRLFTQLFDRGVVVVATSNVPPDRLYWQGLNRQLFLPAIAEIEGHMDVMELVAARDFRLERLTGRKLYFSPADAQAAASLRAIFHELTGSERGAQRSIDVGGRRLMVREAAEGVALMSFAELCGSPLGTHDYLALADAFHTLILEQVPVMAADQRAEARRFINLIDTLYDEHVALVVSAEAEPDRLYVDGKEAFLFERTASRLMEMRSAGYLARRPVQPVPAGQPAA